MLRCFRLDCQEFFAAFDVRTSATRLVWNPSDLFESTRLIQRSDVLSQYGRANISASCTQVPPDLDSGHYALEVKHPFCITHGLPECWAIGGEHIADDVIRFFLEDRLISPAQPDSEVPDCLVAQEGLK